MVKPKIEQIVEAIFEVLPVQTAATVAEVAQEGNMAWQTAQKYLALIIYIQAQPRVHRVTIGDQTGYRRQTKAGRPPKK